jgi:NAD+ synthase (glutamine-hydrolysing)
VIALEPTAELRPLDQVQKDEDDLMPYPTLNRIEELFAKERLSPLAIYELLKSQEVDPILASQIIKFFKLWSRNQWKRERLAPSFQLSHYNIDPRSWFRFPILSGSFQDELKALADL